MHFEWDPAKARKNLRKHEISFEDASSVFYDSLAAIGIWFFLSERDLIMRRMR
ncbi:MAG: BrnT family toxin [Gammaproteobacteria bacterium]|nr:BrnT family toxin [Gammaproteobacteria bacterium]